MVTQRKTPRSSSSSSSSRAARKRRHLHLIDPEDGSEILPDRRVYSYQPLTPWRVEVMMDDPTVPEYQASFRLEDGLDEQEAIVFTLLLHNASLYPLRIRILPNNEIEYESHIPLVFRSHPRKKLITIRLLARVEAVPEGIAVTYTM